jgi:hypothetical protein
MTFNSPSGEKRGPRPPPGTDELERLWEEKGPAAIATLRSCGPGAYVAAIAKLLRDA